MCRILDAGINAGVAFLLVVPPYLFGGVRPGGRTAVEVVAMLAFLAWLWRPRGSEGYLSGSRAFSRRWSAVALAALAGFCLYAALQACPLPSRVVEVLSPSAAAQHRLAGEAATGGAMTLSLSPERTIRDLLLLLSCVAVFLMVAFPTPGQMGRRTLCWVLTANGLALALLAILQEATQRGGVKIFWTVPCRVRPCGPFANPSDFAGYLLMLVPMAVAVGLARAEGGRSEKRLALGGGAAALMSAAIVLSASRSGVGVLLVTMALLTIGLLALFQERRRRAVTVVCALFVLVLGAWAVRATLLKKIEDVGLSWQVRATLRHEASAIVSEFPVFGSGLGTFEVVFPQHRRRLVQQRCFTNAENDFLELTAETGFVGLALATAFLVLWGGMAGRAAWTLRGGHRATLICAAAVACIGALCHSLFHFSLHIPANAVLFAACVGLLRPPAGESRRGYSNAQSG